MLLAAAGVLAALVLSGYRSQEAAVPPPSAASVPLDIPAAGLQSPSPVPPAPETPGESTPFAPARLTIPSIEVEAPVEPVGIGPGGVMNAPRAWDHAGWFELSALAGQQGSTVLVGHRDRPDGRALFWHLDQVRPGDRVTVAGTDGRSLTYVVEQLEAYPYNAVPMDRLFARDRPRLTLITCTGNFDRGTANYSHRLVVYAVLSG